MPYTFNWRFKALDPITKRWYTARYAASIEDIQKRHQQYQVLELDRIIWNPPGGDGRYYGPIPHMEPVQQQRVKVKPKWRVVGTAT